MLQGKSKKLASTIILRLLALRILPVYQAISYGTVFRARSLYSSRWSIREIFAADQLVRLQ